MTIPVTSLPSRLRVILSFIFIPKSNAALLSIEINISSSLPGSHHSPSTIGLSSLGFSDHEILLSPLTTHADLLFSETISSIGVPLIETNDALAIGLNSSSTLGSIFLINDSKSFLISLSILTKNRSGAIDGILSDISFFKLFETKLRVRSNVRPIPKDIVIMGASDFLATIFL